MTDDDCRADSTRNCRVRESCRYEVQYKKNGEWTIYGYTKDDAGWPLKEELEAEGKEVRIIDSEADNETKR